MLNRRRRGSSRLTITGAGDLRIRLTEAELFGGIFEGRLDGTTTARGDRGSISKGKILGLDHWPRGSSPVDDRHWLWITHGPLRPREWDRGGRTIRPELGIPEGSIGRGHRLRGLTHDLVVE